MQSLDQSRLLDEALTSAKQCSFQMERSLDKRNLVDGIQHAADMLKEMRTPFLSPKSYYELYIVITEKLRILECYLIEEHRSGRKVSNLYETVQYISGIVPRLYLMITVGVYLIKCSEFPRREIMRDLVEMCRGVQHPIRGLFLRSYLLHALRADLLPDCEDQLPCMESQNDDKEASQMQSTTAANEKTDVPATPQTTVPTNSEGTITDSVTFLLLNFAEMNKLWVRMQHQGHSREREQREQERRELRLLVGTNLNRLSQLEAIDVNRYKTQVLPHILEQLIECRDVIAQEYLMDVIIQVFPDEFHLATLPLLLRTCGHLQCGVKLRQIVCSLIERLSQYVLNEKNAGHELVIPMIPDNVLPIFESNGENGVADVKQNERTTSAGVENGSESEPYLSNQPWNLFTMFFHEVGRLLNARITLSELSCDPANAKTRHAVLSSVMANGLPPEDIPGIYTALVYLAMLLYPDSSPALVDACLVATADTLMRLGITQVSPISPLSRELLRLLHLPLGGSTPHASNNMTHIGVGSVPNAPLGALGELRTVLGMPGFRRLVSLLDQKTTQWRLACNLLAGALEREQRQRQVRKGSTRETASSTLSSRLTTEADLDGLFDLIDGLLVADVSSVEDPEEFVEAQGLVAGVLHLLGPEPRTEDPVLCLTLLTKAQLRLAQAGPAIVRFNFPSLVFEGLEVLCAFMELGPSTPDWDANVCKTVEFVHRCITMLVASDAPELALRLFLKSALVIDQVAFSKRESMAYEFVSQALTLYEEGVPEARAQIDAITLITSTLCQMRSFGEDDRKTLHTQCTRAAAHLLRKHDQSRAVAATAHLHWPVPVFSRTGTKPSVLISVTDKSEHQFTMPDRSEDISAERLNELRDGKAALSCLDRAARLANDFMDKTVRAQLFIEILNHAISLRLSDCHEITDERLTEWITVIREHIKELPSSATTDQVITHFHNTLAFMHDCRSGKVTGSVDTTRGDDVTELFSAVNLNG